MKIGFFGDSFCATLDKDWGGWPTNDIWPTYETYIKKIQKHYQAEIVNIGQGGSSIYDSILIQLTPFIQEKRIPDVCVFVWTSKDRLFHPDIRHMCFSQVMSESNTGPEWDAARQYFRYLYSDELVELQTKGVLSYFDNTILPLFPKETKIIHLWSFHHMWRYTAEYHYRWKNGLEIRPALSLVSSLDGNINGGSVLNDPDWNHLGGEKKNEIVFNWIQNAIDNYSTGKLITNEL